MKKALQMLLLVSVLLAAFGCSSYRFRQNFNNYAATKMGFPLNPEASCSERDSLRRHIELERFKKAEFYGDSTGYRGFVINTSQSEAIDYVIYDEDGVIVGSGLLENVFQKQQYDYHVQYVVDTLYIPFGKYKVVAKYLDGRTSVGCFPIPSPKDSPFGLQGHWHVTLN
jgi:hypothetical protein